MANVPYDSGVPGALPDTQAPNDLQNVQPTAAAGLDALGEGFNKAATFYDSAAADNAFNDYQSKAIKLLYGDPTKTGADGSPDVGFMGLKGAAAMQARPQVEGTLDQLQKDTLGSLTNDAQKQQFEVYSRRYRNSAAIDIGSHTDQQSTAWYGQVNSDTIQNAKDAISASPLDPNVVQHATSDIVNASLKNAQLQGAVPGDEVWNHSLDQGNKDAFKTRVTAMGTVDPDRAMRMLQNNKDMAGTDYPALYSDLNTKAGMQDGQQAFTEATNNHVQSVSQMRTQTTDAVRSATGLNPTAGMLNNNPGNIKYDPSIQWRGQTGPSLNTDQGSPQVVFDSPEAGMRALAKNVLYKYMRGSTTIGQLIAGPGGWTPGYQPGAVGVARAAGLPINAPVNMNDPGVLQKVLRGIVTQEHGQASTYYSDAMINSGISAALHAAPGTEISSTQPQPAPVQAPSGQAVTLPVSTSQSAVPQPIPLAPLQGQPTSPSGPEDEQAQATALDPHANAVQSILDNPDMDPQRRDAALTQVSKLWTAQQIAQDTNIAQAKARNDQAMNEYGTQILAGAGSSDLQAKMLGDSRLTFEGKKTLTDALMQHANQSASAATAAYGSGFYKAMGQVLAPAGDPAKITDVTDLFRRASVGGDLTLQGANYLAELAGKVTKSIDDSQTTEALHSLIAGQKSKMSFQQDTGPVQIKDPQGEQLFNSRFVPKVLGAYDQWTKAGKDPWQFLTQDNFEKLAQGIRNPREMAMAKMAQDASGVDPSSLPAPPTPVGMDDTGWKLVLNNAPQIDNKPVDSAVWGATVQRLFQDPTPNAMKWFDYHFAGSNITAADVLSTVTPQTNEPMTQWPRFQAPPVQAQPAPVEPTEQQLPAAGGGGGF